MSCYKFEELHYTDPIFNNVDATYIIHLEGNGRLTRIQSQLQRFHPTETVYIMFNKGYKNCKKDEYINTPPLDLVDSFFTVFKDAEQKGYEHILVLEDDFMFDDEILDNRHSEEIERFLMRNKGQNFIYYVGTLPLLQLSTFGFHNRVFVCGGMHSCIYNKTFIQNLVHNVPENKVEDWDGYTNRNVKQYKYYKSLCYQIFPQTENQKYWGYGATIVHFCFQKIIIPVNRYMQLDKTPHPGYTIYEIGSKIITWIILFIIILMSIRFFIFIRKSNKLMNNTLGLARSTKQIKRALTRS